MVVNDNALGGNHAGLFAGKQLLDPAGSYFGVRGRDALWPGPTLTDYARYQTIDGPKIRIYRFHLDSGNFALLRQRMLDAHPTPPLFCAATVQNLLAGLAPFAGLASTAFTTPSALGRKLDALLGSTPESGSCQQLDGSPCRQPGHAP